MDVLHVDCDRCLARGPACGDCVITVLLGEPGRSGFDGAPAEQGVDLDGDEQAALSALAESGMVPPLRLISGTRSAQSVQSPLDWQDYA